WWANLAWLQPSHNAPKIGVQVREEEQPQVAAVFCRRIDGMCFRHFFEGLSGLNLIEQARRFSFGLDDDQTHPDFVLTWLGCGRGGDEQSGEDQPEEGVNELACAFESGVFPSS